MGSGNHLQLIVLVPKQSHQKGDPQAARPKQGVKVGPTACFPFLRGPKESKGGQNGPHSCLLSFDAFKGGQKCGTARFFPTTGWFPLRPLRGPKVIINWDPLALSGFSLGFFRAFPFSVFCPETTGGLQPRPAGLRARPLRRRRCAEAPRARPRAAGRRARGTPRPRLPLCLDWIVEGVGVKNNRPAMTRSWRE